jgi:DNA-binding NarL/FixJ family response regulator
MHPAPLPSPSRISVLVVDDHPVCCESLALVVGGQDDMILAGTAASGAAALAAIRTVPVDVIVLDLSLPGQSGIEVMRALRETGWAGRILVFTGHATEEAIAAAFAGGAATVVEKTSPIPEVLDAIRELHRGNTPMSPRIVSVLYTLLRERRPIQALAPADAAVLRAFAEHRAPKEVAFHLGRSLSSIYKSRRRIISRLDLSPQSDLAKEARKLGLAPLAGSVPTS